MSKWYPGSSARLTCYFYVASALTNPTTVTLKVEEPDGTITDYTSTTNSTTGTYYQDVTLDTEGTWKWRWVGTGTCIAAVEDELEVTRSEFV